MTLIMQMRMGNSGMRRLQEMVSSEDSPDRYHGHAHYHENESPFVLRESNLGQPMYHGNNHEDVRIVQKGARETYVKPRPQEALPMWDVGQFQTQHFPTERSIAIGCAITTRGHHDLSRDNIVYHLPFFKSLLASFCRTATVGFDYHFFIAHDHDDDFFSRPDGHTIFQEIFHKESTLKCPLNLNVSLHLVECAHSGNPSWAQNDAMMAAYMDNMAYYYRLNDDTIMETTGWSEKFIDELERFNPPNVGVVGPWFKEGNVAILTHDFVHRTHLDIFGFYYPRVFTDWFADDWITFVYHPDRCRKVAGTRVKHTMEDGSRYVVRYDKANLVQLEVKIGKMTLKRYIDRRKQSDRIDVLPDTRMVVAMSITGGNMTYLYGALRYSQLVPIIFPNWRVRIYVEANPEKTKKNKFLNLLVKKLASVDVEVIKLEKNVTDNLPSEMWPYLVADDNKVDRFIVRQANTRPSEREWAALEDWPNHSNSFYCIRDHPYHSSVPLVPHLIGGIQDKLHFLLKDSWFNLMKGYKDSGSFLNKVIWPKVKSSCFCHDSISCKVWPGSHPFPVLRRSSEFIGMHYDANDQAVDNNEEIVWNKTFIEPDCVHLDDTGFSERAVKAAIKHRPVFWSQDYHVTPINDIMSLLSPIGIRVIDNSLSYSCKSVGTCAANLKIINKQNGMRLTPELIDQFYNYYKNDLEMKTVSTFVCTLPVAMCEAYVAFNRSMLIIATIRYEQARPEPTKWHALNEMLLNVSKHSKSLVAANNLYDAKYIEYFTGIKPVVIPNYCAYLLDRYNPTRKYFLLTPIHSTELNDKFFTEFDSIVMRKQIDLGVFPLREMYPQYLFSDLAAHPGIVYIPYQVSMVSMTEQYRMNIPLFVPTINLLAKWHVQYQVVGQRTWASYRHQRAEGSDIEGVMPSVPDPNNDLDEEAVKYWLRFADFYQWPHIIYYESMEDLIDKMLTIDLKEISNRMKEHNIKVRQDLKDLWSKVILKITEGVSL